jgi:hypothetical protein
MEINIALKCTYAYCIGMDCCKSSDKEIYLCLKETVYANFLTPIANIFCFRMGQAQLNMLIITYY